MPIILIGLMLSEIQVIIVSLRFDAHYFSWFGAIILAAKNIFEESGF
jgi:hypothetical protein